MNIKQIDIYRNIAIVLMAAFIACTGNSWEARAGNGPAGDLPKVMMRPVLSFYRHMDGTIFSEPMGIFVDAKTKEIYVADTKNDLIGIFDENGFSIFSFGANDVIKEPIKVIKDSLGRIFVVDIDRKRVKIHNYRGEFLDYFTSPHLGDNTSISTIAADQEGNIYIGDSGTSQVLVFDPQHKLKVKFGNKGADKGQFQAIAGIAIDREGKIYVTDYQAIAVQVFDRQGKFLRGWGEHSMGAHNFSLPGGIAVDSSGRVIVVDTLRHDIKVFDQEGKYLDRFGGFGNKPGDVAYPVDIFIDSNDRIYVMEKLNRRVQAFDQVQVEAPRKKGG